MRANSITPSIDLAIDDLSSIFKIAQESELDSDARGIYLECLENTVSELKMDEGFWDLVLELQDRHDEVESRLPDIDDSEFEKYIIIGDLIGVIGL